MTRNRSQFHRTNRFPGHLHNVLQDAISDPALAEVISWEPSGTAFKIHDQRSFVAKVLPRHFPKMKSYKSFRRQLNMYGLKVQNLAESTNSAATIDHHHSCSPSGNQDNSSARSKTMKQRNEVGKVVVVPVLSSGIYSHPLLRRGRLDLVDAIPRSTTLMVPTPIATIQSSQPNTIGAAPGCVVFLTNTSPPPGSCVTAFAAVPALSPPLAPLVTATTSTNIMTFPYLQQQGEKRMENGLPSDHFCDDTNIPFTTTPRSTFVVVSPQATATTKKEEEAGWNDDPLLGLTPMMLGEVINANMNYSYGLPHVYHDRIDSGMFTHPSTFSIPSHECCTAAAAASWIEDATSSTKTSSDQTLQSKHHHMHCTNWVGLQQADINNEIIRTFC